MLQMQAKLDFPSIYFKYFYAVPLRRVGSFDRFCSCEYQIETVKSKKPDRTKTVRMPYRRLVFTRRPTICFQIQSSVTQSINTQ